MLLCHDIAIQALHHYLALIGCMNHAVLAFVETDVLSYLGIAILILCEQGAETAPATQVAPSELGWQGIDFLRLLHHRIVDANLLASWEEFAYHHLLIISIEGRSHLVHDARQLRLEGTDSLADGLNVPYEDASIPIVIASGKILFSSLQVWLLLEGFHLIDFIYRCWLGCGNIAIAKASDGVTTILAFGCFCCIFQQA